jgi:hypothetical protein
MRRCIRVFVPLALLAACAAPDTLVQTSDIAAFSATSTFGIETLAATGSSDPQLASRLNVAVEKEIARSLAGKGYRQVALAEADLKVEYRLASLGRVPRNDRENPREESRPKMGAGDPFGDYEPLTGAGAGARHGLLLVMITSAKSGAVVWQATSEGIANGADAVVRMATRGARDALARVPAVGKHPG